MFCFAAWKTFEWERRTGEAQSLELQNFMAAIFNVNFVALKLSGRHISVLVSQVTLSA